MKKTMAEIMEPIRERTIVTRRRTEQAHQAMAKDPACPTSVLLAFAVLAERITDIEDDVFGPIDAGEAEVSQKVDTQGR